ncbi:sugar-transfer associated ATP-grasp domain-containing protein [Zobellia galactanivorans]|uniref:sugar-transfer associated ATP-grasp domain-containing protein n=1 Tax=Zobellia galactanivorans (strain DSM 12802 / CCUG 47099 / CIP 106680 / NCIMB 13871 / Dsij) TaxID=63186 RepID=UPI001C07B6D5|nr:sugar-transfer associated ATP-grasp domain-containing protein [Zobellia galactanivorans]MBU3028340.1 hypothetical protein [Zobellia galactanivorans]
MGLLNFSLSPKQVADRLISVRYNYISKKSAFKALKNIEQDKGRLSPKTKKEAVLYAKETLGSKKYAPWLYVYAAISGGFKEGWIPDNYYRNRVIPKTQGDYGRISFLKTLNNKIFDAEISPDIAYYINGQWFKKDLTTPLSFETLHHICFQASERVVFKLDQSYQGNGVFVLNSKSFNRTEIENKGNGTLQRFIVQHKFFDQFSTRSVANIRMTTVIDKNGKPSLRACYLRLGRSKDSHVKSCNHIRVPVDVETGELAATAYLANWKTIGHHPDSRVEFANKTIPHYQECVDLALNLHCKFPLVKSIGWDIALDNENRPTVMEWNGYGNDIKFSEATQGPCFKDLNWQIST